MDSLNKMFFLYVIGLPGAVLRWFFRDKNESFADILLKRNPHFNALITLILVGVIIAILAMFMKIVKSI